MKIEKNKIVFGSVLFIIMLFIVAYSALIFMEQEEGSGVLSQPSVPALEEEQETYSSRIEALNELREVRRSNPPSMYSESLLDSLGVYDPLLEEKQREEVVDSIYELGRDRFQQRGRIDLFDKAMLEEQVDSAPELEEIKALEDSMPTAIVALDFALSHEEFFRPRVISTQTNSPIEKPNQQTDSLILAKVNGQQKVRINDRLELMLAKKAIIDGKQYPQNSLLYGFIRLQPNRVHIEITHIQGRKTSLTAFDLQDSKQGIYIRNSFSAQAVNQAIGDVIQDINITGLPQVRGIKSLFARNNRNIKVTIMDQYQLILKPES